MQRFAQTKMPCRPLVPIALSLVATLSCAASLALDPFPNSDGDSIGDALDNCTLVDNPLQRDTDGDGFGNYCDADFNNDSVVNFQDFFYLQSVFLTSDELADLNGDGTVNFIDYSLATDMFLEQPGPRGFCVNNPICDGPTPADFSMSVGQHSMVIRLSDPELIAHARSLVAGGTTAYPHVIGEMTCASTSYSPDWDFHMTEGTIGFFDAAIEVCDASIPYAEANCDGWAPVFWCPWQSQIDAEVGN